MTFREWCIENNRLDFLDDWDYELTGFTPDDISYGSSNRKVFIKCHRHLHESTAISPYSLTVRNKCICTKCNSLAQFVVDLKGEEFLRLIWSEKNTIDPFDVPFSSTKKVHLICTKNRGHGEYEIKCNRFANGLRNGWLGCPMCHVHNTKPAYCDCIANNRPDVYKYWSPANHLSPTDVTTKSHKKILWMCPDNKHEDFSRSVSESVRYDFRCPQCSFSQKTSRLQNKVSDYLQELGFTVNHEYDCTLIPERYSGSGRFMPYDNEVKELQTIIEVNGKQHYSMCSWHLLTAERNGTTPEEELADQKARDAFKRNYAIAHGYSYLAIPYTAEEDDKYKEIIDSHIHSLTIKESVTTTA